MTRRSQGPVTHRNHGFTIIEFMVAVGLMSILMLGIASSFTFQQETYVVVDQVAEAKQNVRVVADLMERELRNAGYLVPATGITCGVDDDAGPDKLYVSDASSLVALNALSSTLLTQPLGGIVENPGTAAGGGTPTLNITDLDIDQDGSDDFTTGAGIILADRNAASTAVACGTITNIGAVALGPVPVQVSLENGTGAMPPGAELVAIPAIVYELQGNQLVRNGVVIVDNVEDFQIAWFFDNDGDRQIDPGEYLADGVGAADDYDPTAVDNAVLREVRINVVVRTRDEDPDDDWQQGIGQVTENRTPASVAPVDGARRRVHTSTVRLRNNLS